LFQIYLLIILTDMKNKKIIIAGGTGFIGQVICNYFGADNEIVILTRQSSGQKTNAFGKNTISKELSKNIRYVKWDGITIFDSRINSVKILGLVIQQAVHPPKLWINAASATIYPHATSAPRDEDFTAFADDFSVQVCKLWEKTFYEQRTPFTRKVALRMAITLGAGGVMIPYFNLLKFGLGGKQGNGNQMYSWVHIEDTCRMIEWIVEHKELEGTYNCVSPNAVTNKIFMATLRKVTGYMLGLPAYEWMLVIGAKLIGTETELILKSRWVLPTRILQSGFEFKYPDLEQAFKEIISQTPRKHYHLF